MQTQGKRFANDNFDPFMLLFEIPPERKKKKIHMKPNENVNKHANINIAYLLMLIAHKNTVFISYFKQPYRICD